MKTLTICSFIIHLMITTQTAGADLLESPNQGLKLPDLGFISDWKCVVPLPSSSTISDEKIFMSLCIDSDLISLISVKAFDIVLSCRLMQAAEADLLESPSQGLKLPDLGFISDWKCAAPLTPPSLEYIFLSLCTSGDPISLTSTEVPNVVLSCRLNGHGQ